MNTYFFHSAVLENCKSHIKFILAVHLMFSCSLSVMQIAATAPTEMNLSLAGITLAHSASSGSPQIKAKG